MMCHFCKNNGHTRYQCPILAEVTCSRCNGKGHNQAHCPVPQKDVDFPPLGSGSTPCHPGSTPRIPGSRTRHPGSTPPVAKSSSYEDAVKRRANDLISHVMGIAGQIYSPKWFQIYPRNRQFDDKFLRRVNDYILSEVQTAELDYEDAQYVLELAAEKRDMEIEAKAKKDRAERINSMTPEQFEIFEEEQQDYLEWECQKESYYLYECGLDFIYSLETQKQKVEELLNQMEQKQVQRSCKKYEQGRMLRSSDERPRHTLWSAIQKKMY